MSELKRRLFKVVGDAGQSESSRPEPIEEIREGIAQLLKQTRERYGQSLRDVSANLLVIRAVSELLDRLPAASDDLEPASDQGEVRS